MAMEISMLLLVARTPILTNTSATASSVHHELAKNSLLPGIFPDSMTRYSFVRCHQRRLGCKFSSPCYVMFTDLVYYGTKMQGKLRVASSPISRDIKGIEVKQLFAWLTEIFSRADWKMLDFLLLKFCYAPVNYL